MSILRQVTLQRANRKADKSISISFVTSLEESPEAFMEVDRLVNTSGVIYYSEKGTLTQQEKDEIDNVENFMDYANGGCMNMFTNGQLNRVEGYLASSAGRATYRHSR
jgi:hypothetical protein